MNLTIVSGSQRDNSQSLNVARYLESLSENYSDNEEMFLDRNRQKT